MQQAPANVQAVVAPVVDSLGYELVGIEYLTQGYGAMLRVYIDSDEGITVDDCSRVSHQLSGVLDVEDIIRGKYQLEVSSPGLERPLFTEEHFVRFSGHQVKLKLSMPLDPLDGRRKFHGLLHGIEDGKLQLEVDGEMLSVPFNSIDKANLVAKV